MKNTYYNIKTRHFEDYAMNADELAEIIALHTKDKAIYCVETFTEETEEDDLEDYWTHPTLSAAERNR
tara:strand:+ start:294 stop:497 length:204 start_codon:yes stop_codon:yes gene_type:complete